MGSSLHMLAKLRAPNDALQVPEDPVLALKDPALKPLSHTVAPDRLPPAPEVSLVVQMSPANQPSMVAQPQPDIAHSHLTPQPSPWAQKQVEAANGLTAALDAILAGPTLSRVLTPELRANVGAWLDSVAKALFPSDDMRENLENRYNNDQLDKTNQVDHLAGLYFAWSEALENQPQFQPARASGR